MFVEKPKRAHISHVEEDLFIYPLQLLSFLQFRFTFVVIFMVITLDSYVG